MDGVTCGTEGRGLPLNGLRFTLSGNGISGGISSSVNLIKNGWQGWKEAGELNGNAGNGQAVQAVRLKLTGEAAQQYDLYYRVHSKTYGWLDWAKNGQIAGTIGLISRWKRSKSVSLKRMAEPRLYHSAFCAKKPGRFDLSDPCAKLRLAERRRTRENQRHSGSGKAA